MTAINHHPRAADPAPLSSARLAQIRLIAESCHAAGYAVHTVYVAETLAMAAELQRARAASTAPERTKRCAS
jgi:hypothetical protein